MTGFLIEANQNVRSVCLLYSVSDSRLQSLACLTLALIYRLFMGKVGYLGTRLDIASD